MFLLNDGDGGCRLDEAGVSPFLGGVAESGVEVPESAFLIAPARESRAEHVQGGQGDIASVQLAAYGSDKVEYLAVVVLAFLHDAGEELSGVDAFG